MNPLSIKPLYLAVAAALAFGSGWQINDWRLHTQISEMKAVTAEAKGKDAAETVTAMQADAKSIHDAATELGASKNMLGSKIDVIIKGMKNAKPLPAGCKPDDLRVHSLDAAIEAANAAAAGH